MMMMEVALMKELNDDKKVLHSCTLAKMRVNNNKMIRPKLSWEVKRKNYLPYPLNF